MHLARQQLAQRIAQDAKDFNRALYKSGGDVGVGDLRATLELIEQLARLVSETMLAEA